MIKKVLKIIFWLFLFLVLLLFSFLGYQTIIEYNPDIEEEIAINQQLADTVKDTLTIVTWNVGYFGLGAGMDFFYEGGTMVRPTALLNSDYGSSILGRVSSFKEAEFILLQELDTLSHRSYYQNQFDAIEQNLPGYSGYFAMNYNAWVPMPVTEPMGKVRAGLATFSIYRPARAVRASLQSSYNWPVRLFQLKRCFLETRFKTFNGKELVLVNTHNSAYDDAAELREKELSILKRLMLEEYEKGNYVIIGGDWNQNPPPFDTTSLLPIYKPKYIRPGIPDDFLPAGWIYAFDPRHTTNRDVNKAYEEGISITTLIDFFVLSPNVKLLNVETIPTRFLESDHQPVVMKISLE